VQLNWTNVNAQGYAIYRGTTDGGPYVKIAQVPATQWMYIDRNLTVGVTYYWMVRSLAASMDEIAQSNQVTAKIVGR
jgi:fibronectin type 3 domain-containing protein